jgi:hypothetical protein
VAEKFALFTAVSYVFVYVGWLLLSQLKKKGKSMVPTAAGIAPCSGRKIHPFWCSWLCCYVMQVGYCSASAAGEKIALFTALTYVFVYKLVFVLLAKKEIKSWLKLLPSSVVHHDFHLFAVFPHCASGTQNKVSL